MVDLREHAQRLIDRTDDIVDIGLEQKHSTVVIGNLDKIADHIHAILEALFGLVLGMVHPVAVGRERSGFGDHIGTAEIARVANERLEMIEPALALVLIGMDDIGIAGDATYGQVVLPRILRHLSLVMDTVERSMSLKLRSSWTVLKLSLRIF